ncbi:hypothetical protein F0562_020903 [Nyssa sinensis]|uniref:BHLH domain-containing protein n=1 Tax=Nyssa sinensis TaxID=561372 RepID=A0A5J5BSL7_9ASTE|nr:hypothetical protein F0562_020903 [Nyssa sinensis]
MNPSTFSSNVTSPGFAVSEFPGLKTGQTKGAHGLFHFSPPPLESLLSIPYPYLKEKQPASSYGLGVKATPNAEYGSVQRRFLIFDQSGNQTRLIFAPVCSPAHHPIIAPKTSICDYDLHDKKQAGNLEETFPIKPIIEEKSDENHMLEESEMHEDTEEINALLYSEEDSDGDGDGDGWWMMKQRLLDGGYKKSPFVDIASSVKLDRTRKCDDDAESSCAKGRTQEKDGGSILGNKHLRKDKIRETLRILESIIPGVKSKDPLSVIDEAIDYLKSLKLKAKALGVSYP